MLLKIKVLVTGIFVLLVIACIPITVMADETDVKETTNATESMTNYAVDNDCSGYYTVHVSYTDAVKGKGTQGMLKLKSKSTSNHSYVVDEFNEQSFIKDYPGIKVVKYSEMSALQGQEYVPLDARIEKGKYYLAQFVSRNNKIEYTGVLAVLTEANEYWFTRETKEESEDTDGTDMSREMTGQVELNELDDATLNRLAEINNELENLKKTSANGFATTVVNVVTNIVGILLITYAVILIVTYIIEVMGVGDDTIRPFYLATFKKNWAVGNDYTFFSTYAMADMHGGVTIVHLIGRSVLLTICGILAISVDWFTIAYTVYHALKG